MLARMATRNATNFSAVIMSCCLVKATSSGRVRAAPRRHGVMLPLRHDVTVTLRHDVMLPLRHGVTVTLRVGRASGRVCAAEERRGRSGRWARTLSRLVQARAEPHKCTAPTRPRAYKRRHAPRVRQHDITRLHTRLKRARANGRKLNTPTRERAGAPTRAREPMGACAQRAAQTADRGRWRIARGRG
jgi:hypothetical protein